MIGHTGEYGGYGVQGTSIIRFNREAHNDVW